MRETYLSVSGVVASEPRVVQLDDNRLITSFRLASTPRRRDSAGNGWVDGPTTWVTVTCWRDLAVNAAESLHKRDRVLVHGRMRTRDFTATDGQQRTTVELDAESLGHDLAFGVSTYDRRTRAKVVDPARAAAEELAAQVAAEAEALVGGPLPAGLEEEMAALAAEDLEAGAPTPGAGPLVGATA